MELNKSEHRATKVHTDLSGADVGAGHNPGIRCEEEIA